MNNACDRVRRRARWLRYAILAVMLAAVLVNALLAWRNLLHHQALGGWPWLDISAQPAGHPRLAVLMCLSLSMIYLYGLYRLLLLMRLFEQGEFFSIGATGHLRVFAGTLLVGTIVGCVLPAVALAVMHMAGLNHDTSVSLQLDGSDVWMILVSTLFFVIAWILSEARQLAEDNQLIV